MTDRIVERHMDVLQNIELGLVIAYRKHTDLVDTGTMYALDTLIKHYNAQSQGRTIALPEFKPGEQAAFDNVKGMCEWRLGREGMETEAGEKIDLGDTPLTLEEITSCLKRIRKSVELWYKKGGRRGYYEFVKNYVK